MRSFTSSQNHQEIAFPDLRHWPRRPGTYRHFESKSYPANLSRGLLGTMMIIALIGLGLATYLGWVALTSSQVAGCGGGQVFDCSHVMNSKWSKVIGIPVGIPAATLYLVTLVSLSVTLLSSNNRLRNIATGVVSIAAFSAGFAALWFIMLQLFVVEHLCSYCLAAHTCGLVLAAVVLWKLPFGLRSTLKFAGVSFAGVAMLATAQVLADEPKSFEIIEHPATPTDEKTSPATNSVEQDNLFGAPGNDDQSQQPDSSDSNLFEAPAVTGSSRQSTDPKSSVSNLSTMSLHHSLSSNSAMNPSQESVVETRELNQQEARKDGIRQQVEERNLVSISGGKIQLDVAQWPLVGNTDAEITFVEMFDYTCPHCRENHQFVKAALDQLDNKVAMIALVVPMNSRCNNTTTVDEVVHRDACELARLSVAVWRVDPAKFTEFHNWLFEGDSAPTATSARAHAGELVDPQKLEAEIASDVPAQYVAKHVELYKSIGAGSVPKLLFSGSTVNGTVESTEALLGFIQRNNGNR